MMGLLSFILFVVVLALIVATVLGSYIGIKENRHKLDGGKAPSAGYKGDDFRHMDWDWNKKPVNQGTFHGLSVDQLNSLPANHDWRTRAWHQKNS